MDEEVDHVFAVEDGITVVAQVPGDVAGAVGAVVEPPHRRHTVLPSAEHAPLEPLLRVAEGVLAAVEGGDGGVCGGKCTNDSHNEPNRGDLTSPKTSCERAARGEYFF